jgi:hypothetical protein
MIYALFGPLGCGRGTQAELLIRALGDSLLTRHLVGPSETTSRSYASVTRTLLPAFIRGGLSWALLVATSIGQAPGSG